MDCPSENTLSAFVDGRLPRADIEAIEAHARVCNRCPRRIDSAREAASGRGTDTVANVAVAYLRPRDQSEPRESVEPGAHVDADMDGAELERGASIGRYTILALVGRGGMGEVYAAYDPELDRKIALKLLRARSSDRRSRSRLLREAKAIAKLSHPNVVVVHDAGTFDERVFIAMEFVEGRTLKEWLAEAPRTRREILDVFVSAARGLSAAHAAGLVHRDFKPQNVMVSVAGAVRVMDFGLAREIDADGQAPGEAALEAGAEPLLMSAASSSRTSDGDLTFTRTGELVGTPLYMAPEQFMAARTDARTDQFSFCVALHQALFRAHPFAGDSIDVLVARVLTADVQPPPAKHDVPTWLRRVVLRGLAVEPAARWPSMAALIEALERDPARARRRWGAAAGVALLVGAATITLVRGPRRAESLCLGGPARLAGLWEPAGPAGTPRPRRDALAAAFERAGGAQARETWTRVEGALDRYAASWLGMYRDACEATHARGEQSSETLDLRMGCLDERRDDLRALTDVLATADGTAIASAVDAVNALPSVARCGDVKLLREPIDSPRDEATRTRAQDLRARLATARMLHLTGKQDESVRRVRGLVVEARALGYRSLIAEALDTEGEVQDGPNFQPGSVDVLAESVYTALAVKRDDVAARAAALLATDVGYYLGRREEGWRWARLSSALLDRLGPGQDLLRSWLLHDEGNIKMAAHDYEGALALFRGAVALKEKILPPDHPDIAISMAAIGETLHRMGNDVDALAIMRRSIEIEVRAYGPESSNLAQTLSNEGEYLVALGRAEEAVTAFETSIAHFGKTSGPESALLAYPLTGLAEARLVLGHRADAVPLLEHALRLRATAPPDDIDAADTRFALARALPDTAKERPRARRLAVAARDVYARVGEDPQAKLRAKAVDEWLARHE